jgi:hypothetical protein
MVRFSNDWNDIDKWFTVYLLEQSTWCKLLDIVKTLEFISFVVGYLVPAYFIGVVAEV